VPGLVARVLEGVRRHPDPLYMDYCRRNIGCETRHCFSWRAVKLAGEAGKAAEERLGTTSAAALLLGGSDHPFGTAYREKVIPWLEARVKEEEREDAGQK